MFSSSINNLLNSTTNKLESISLSSFENNNDIDRQLSSLYGDVDILEEKCKLSIRGESTTLTQTNSNESITIDNNQLSKEHLIKTYTIMKTSNSVIDNLNKEYYNPDFDPIESILCDVSTWSEIIDSGFTDLNTPKQDSDETINTDRLNEKFMKKIEETDTDKDFILLKLSELIQANYNELNDCLKNASIITTGIVNCIRYNAYYTCL